VSTQVGAELCCRQRHLLNCCCNSSVGQKQGQLIVEYSEPWEDYMQYDPHPVRTHVIKK
jgi:hypothetical protein